MFIRNRRRWDGEAWLRNGGEPTLFKVSDHNAHEVQAGDLGLLRLNAVSVGTSHERPVAVYAVVEVTGPPALSVDDIRGVTDAALVWQAPVRVVADLSEAPIPVSDLPDDAQHQPVRDGQQTASVAIVRRVFATVFSKAGLERDSFRRNHIRS